MNEPGIKLTTYFSERDRAQGRFLADAMFAVYERHQVRTSVLLRGAHGFGRHHHLETDRLLTLSETLPAVSIAVDARDRIQSLLPEVLDITTHGLISLERALVLSGPELHRAELGVDQNRIYKLTLYGGRGIRSAGQAGYVTAIELLREQGAIGASVLLAVDGTLHGSRRRARFFARNGGVPLMILAVADGATLTSVLPRVAGLLEEPVGTVERLEVCKVDGTPLSEPHDVAAHDPSGLPIWQKVMIHAEEQAKHHGRPLHVELVRRLREAGAAGATVLRGVRGFYAGREPFADRVLALRRNVPVHVIVVDTPPNIQRWWPIIDAVTETAGLVTSELVPASRSSGADRARSLELARTPTMR